ncbi:SLC13 family permease [Petroclostridium sp. X23]|uniref:SLC13 family permease n=1 Tax=Petroclostridium sp. X23 TaxID=3045146 RepID=UPI0024ACB4F7|nr:SLC13 family permease [Petroclostridium sp. X23]WHH61140.1 SLC13 family permease [Petroclostridium sp. X23]
MTNYLSLLSLVFLIAAIAVGFIKKLNVGFIAVGFALVIGRITGMSDKVIISGFNTSLFVMLVGISYLFSIAQINGTLELIAKKFIALAGKKTYLIPIIMYILGAVIAAIGPGTIPAFALAAAFGVPLALAMKTNPLLLTSMGQLGAIGGGMTAIAPTGIIGINLSAQQGINNVAIPLLGNAIIGSAFFAIILYIAFKGYKAGGENPLKLKDLPKFNKNQIITMLGILLMVTVTIAFKINVGLSSFLIATILTIFNIADEKECIKSMPWGTLILVTGVGVLMNVVIASGGINIMAKALASIMNEKTAAPLIGLTSGIMSWFSSTSGVVMPTMIPTVNTVMQTVGGNLSGPELVSAISVVASVAGLSPASTGGALVLSAYLTNVHLDDEEQNKLFARLFIISVCAVIALTLFVGLGGFKFIK